VNKNINLLIFLLPRLSGDHDETLRSAFERPQGRDTATVERDGETKD
jgi:hypothetical protein